MLASSLDLWCATAHRVRNTEVFLAKHTGRRGVSKGGLSSRSMSKLKSRVKKAIICRASTETRVVSGAQGNCVSEYSLFSVLFSILRFPSVMRVLHGVIRHFGGVL